MLSPNVTEFSTRDNSATHAQAGPVAKPERRRELDMIGPFIVLGLIVAHTLTIFVGRDIIVDNSRSEVTYLVAAFLVTFSMLWAMPLMMLIAGTTIWYNLRKRTVAEFARERFKRLFVPFVTGLVLAVPPMVYFKVKQEFAYAESFLEFYPRFWQIKFSLSAFPYTIQADFYTDLGVAGLSVRFVKGVASWFWLVAIMGYITHRGRHNANPKPDVVNSARTQSAGPPTLNAKASTSSLFDRAIAYVRDGQVPLYVIHKTPIIVFGYYVVQWNVNDLVKFAVIALSSLVAVLLLYEFGIRRTAVTRFLLGMKTKKG